MLLEPLRAVANFSFYRQVPKKTFWATVGYIAYLSLFYAAATTLAVHLRFQPLVAEAVDWASTTLPPLTLAGGKFSTVPPQDQPLQVRHAKVPDLLFVIDTNRTAPLSSTEMSESKAQVYLTQSAVYLFNPSSRKMETYDLSQAKNPEPLVVDAALFRRLGGLFSAVLDPVTFVFAYLFSFVGTHFWALIYSVVALMINGFLAGSMRYEQLYKLAVYAMTPAVVLEVVSIILMRPIPFRHLLALMLVGVYLWRAIRQCGLPREELEGPAVP